jgi:hypothetical protein
MYSLLYHSTLAPPTTLARRARAASRIAKMGDSFATMDASANQKRCAKAMAKSRAKSQNNQELNMQLITIDITGATPTGLGAKPYMAHPRIGEWVELEIDGIGIMFLVVMVAHSSTGAGSQKHL